MVPYATVDLPEKMDYAVRDLDTFLAVGDIHLTERFWVRDSSALHDPGGPIRAVQRG